MAGDSIKMRAGLLSDPHVVRMARVLLRNPVFCEWTGTTCDAGTGDATVREARLVPVVTRATIGALLALCHSVDQNASDVASMRGVTLFEIDTMAGMPGLGEALVAVGWVEVVPDDSARSRAQHDGGPLVVSLRRLMAAVDARHGADGTGQGADVPWLGAA